MLISLLLIRIELPSSFHHVNILIEKLKILYCTTHGQASNMNNELDVALISTLLHDKCPTKKYFLKKIDCMLIMIKFNDEKFHRTNM